MSPTLLYRFSGGRSDRSLTVSASDDISHSGSGANFDTDWAFDEVLVALRVEPERDLGFVSDWALPSVTVAEPCIAPP